MIAYVGDGSANSIETGRDDLHGLAIAMQDCSSSNTGTGNWDGTGPYTAWCDQDDAANCTSEVSSDVEVARGWKDGISMTSTLASATAHTHWAAKAASSYLYDTSNPNAPLPAVCSGWFLPSLGQWQLIIQGLVSKIDGEPYSEQIVKGIDQHVEKMKSTYFYSILYNAGATNLSGGWSCSEYGFGNAWCVYLGSSGYALYSARINKEDVRAVLAF